MASIAMKNCTHEFNERNFSFNAFYNRTKDWADLEEMMAAGTLDIEFASNVLIKYLGEKDERIKKLQDLGVRFSN